MTTTLIVGASGTVGSELARQLAAAGHTVRRATSRPPTAADQVQLDLVNDHNTRRLPDRLTAKHLVQERGAHLGARLEAFQTPTLQQFSRCDRFTGCRLLPLPQGLYRTFPIPGLRPGW